MATLFENFTEKYSLSKTLRFELKPIGKTLEHIETQGILKRDEKRAKDYKILKKLIDEYHKKFISKVLNDKENDLGIDLLRQFETQYLEKKTGKKANNTAENSKDKKVEFIKTAESLRKKIKDLFEADKELKTEFKALFGSELFTEYLGKWITQGGKESVLALHDKLNPDGAKSNEMEKFRFFSEKVESFNKWTSYFGGFHENRKNIYVDKEQSTAISYRIVHENLPKFIDNCQVFKTIQTKVSPEILTAWENELQRFLFCPLAEIFNIQYFNQCLSQEQIDLYNRILGGETEEIRENGKTKAVNKHKGLNELINLYNQQQKEKKDRLPKLTVLFKQILSDSIGSSFVVENFTDANELKEAVLELDDLYFNNKFVDNIEIFTCFDSKIKKLFKELRPDTNWEQIYIRNTNLAAVSANIFGGGEFGYLKNALSYAFTKTFSDENQENKKKKGKSEQTSDKKNQEALDNYLKKPYFSVAEVENALRLYITESTGNEENGGKIIFLEKEHILADYCKSFEVKKKDVQVNLISALTQYRALALPILQNKVSTLSKIDIETVKNYMDAWNAILHFIKQLQIDDKSKLSLLRDSDFYHELDEILQECNKPLTLLYDKVRNFVTKKPYSVEKFKLNFENVNLMKGFVESNGSTQYCGYLFRKETPLGYEYFLGISLNTKLFSSTSKAEAPNSEYERLNYYQMKVSTFYGNSFIGNYSTMKKEFIDIILKVLKNESQIIYDEIKGKIKDTTPTSLLNIIKAKELTNVLQDTEVIQQEKVIIDNILKTLDKKYKNKIPKAKEVLNKQWNNLGELISEIDKLANNKTFDYKPISQKDWETVTNDENKHFYIFQILNKDLKYSEKRKLNAKDNLHTLYFKQLMAGNQDIYDIGSAEIFYRPASIDRENTIIHKKNISINNKNENNPKLQSTFAYDLIKDNRFVENKFQFHLSFKQNFTKPEKYPNLNNEVCQAIQSEPSENIHIIGIDRGERHLLYYSVINTKGEIIEQGSLNEMHNSYQNREGEQVEISYNYQNALDKKEKERAESRESWQSIGNIKELKEGYLSQIVHKISLLMVKYNAFVVLEDLNFGFKRGRFKVEKQVYQKFEKALIDKLNFLVFKDKNIDEKGGLLQAYQLTEKFESFQKMGKQTGFLFYVAAANTSKIDFKTGFINTIYPKFESVDQAQKLIKAKFSSIRFNSEKDYFEFTTLSENNHKSWIICSHGVERHVYDSKANNHKSIDVTAELKKIFAVEKIDLDFDKNILEDICNSKSKTLLSSLMYLLKILLQMRYNDGNQDYILSPVADDKTGNFWDSRGSSKHEPQDPDANGAYHIAKKGLLLYKKINGEIKSKKTSQKKEDSIDLLIDKDEWIDFAQK